MLCSRDSLAIHIEASKQESIEVSQRLILQSLECLVDLSEPRTLSYRSVIISANVDNYFIYSTAGGEIGVRIHNIVSLQLHQHSLGWSGKGSVEVSKLSLGFDYIPNVSFIPVLSIGLQVQSVSAVEFSAGPSVTTTHATALPGPDYPA
jgi:hypothetical protein